MKNGKNLCSGNAIVQCSHASTYSQILESSNLSFEGRSIFCEPMLTGEALHAKNLMLSYRRVFVSNLPFSMSDNTIKQVFTQFGPVQNAYRIRSMAMEDRPFGFVTFYDSASADLAATHHKIHYKSTALYISHFQKHKSQLEKTSPQQVTAISSHDDNLCLRNDNSGGISGHIKCPISSEYTKPEMKVPNPRWSKPDESYYKERAAQGFSLGYQACKPNKAIYHKTRKTFIYAHKDEQNIRFNTAGICSHSNMTSSRGNIGLRSLAPRNNVLSEEL